MEPALSSGRCGLDRPRLPFALFRAALALTLVLSATGCGGGSAASTATSSASAADTGGRAASPTRDAPGTPTATDMTGVDLLYLSMTAGHTEQTLRIVRLVHDRLTDPELRTLVAAIEVTEAEELATVRRWLAQAGRSARADDHTGHGAGPDQLARLRDAEDGEVDKVLIEVLSAHQRAAADLARAHLAAGTEQGVRDLARRIEQSRTAQVAMLAAHPAAA
ncbi:DUF305 domain-containing protein [Micromonospora sp. NPDC048871]|uniref:DUF305 domain-containing protein n=1 Tax=unclassified Micromonospora TaxID=2617518 RepID=UPI002E15C2BB|nr:DUF305 domain-containing protein [Micromonospora sp. NBC_01739]